MDVTHSVVVTGKPCSIDVFFVFQGLTGTIGYWLHWYGGKQTPRGSDCLQ